MDTFALLMEKTMDVFKTELTLWGFTFSYWQVFAFAVVAGIVAWVLGEIFLGD